MSTPHSPSAVQNFAHGDSLSLETSVNGAACLTPLRNEWQCIASLLEQAVKQGCIFLHIEPDLRFWRIRHRYLDHFDELLEHNPDELVRALQALQTQFWGGSYAQTPARHKQFLVAITGLTYRINLDVVTTTNGDTFCFELRSESITEKLLDQIGLRATQLHQIRRLLQHGQGCLAIASPHLSDTNPLITAMIKAVTAPDRKLLYLNTLHCLNLPRVTQVALAELDTAQQTRAAATALRLDNDIVFIAREYSDCWLPQIRATAGSNPLVVQSFYANNASTLLNRLINAEYSQHWLATHLHAIVVQQDVRRLCEHCKVRTDLDKETELWLNAQRPSAAIDIVAWFDAGATHCYLQGQGCAQCHQQGFNGTRSVFDIVEIDENLQHALMQDNITEVQKLLRSQQGLQNSIMALCRRGETSLAEAMRVFRIMQP